MTNRTCERGAVLYESGMDTVKTLDIVARGIVRASSDYCTIDMPTGSIIGIGENPGNPYIFSYEALEEVTIFSYPYESEASLVALFKVNQKLLSMLVAGAVRFAKNLQTATLDSMELARSEYARIKAAAEDYPQLTIAAGVPPREFQILSSIRPPSMLDTARGWHRDFVEDLFAYEAKFKKEFYAVPSIGLAIGLTINSYALESREFILSIFGYLDSIKSSTQEFMSVYQSLQTMAASGGTGSGDSKVDDSSVHDPLGAISMFAAPGDELLSQFGSDIGRFMKHGDRYGSADDIRRIRREIGMNFYQIYAACFFKSVYKKWKDIPLGVRMFLLFGYANEQLAGADNAAKLAVIADSWTPGQDDRIVTVFDWLSKIYRGEEMPSKNEFDLDYPNYLKTAYRNGEISEPEMRRLAESAEDRVLFEIRNLFTSGNRMTFGRITTFVPIFDKDNVPGQIERIYVKAAHVNEQLKHVVDIDYLAYCRQGVFSDTENGVNTFFTQDEVLPYVILMPNVGSRAALWQEIDAKKRSTPARMLLSIFHTENLEDTMIRLTGDFRWEMCKTEQGVHWNDITDPSLTSMYCDYLQFYRKNSALSQETKEKISIALKNNSNNFKKIFVEDYYIYMKYEAQGAVRLNKTARGILFSFCPFSKTVRDRIGDNPQFADCIKKHEGEAAARMKLIDNINVKYQKKGLALPAKLQEQRDLCKQ